MAQRIRSFRPTDFPRFQAAEAGSQHSQEVELGAGLIESHYTFMTKDK